LLAAGHSDSVAHIFSIEYNDNKEISVTPWEFSLDVTNGIKDIRWSTDSRWLLTFTKDQDLMVWYIEPTERTFEHYLYWLDPDMVAFEGNPLLAGWDVQGLFQSSLGWDGTDLNSLSLTRKTFKKTSPVLPQDCKKGTKPQYECKLIASGDGYGYVRVHNYPSINEEGCYHYNGHSSHVCQVCWSNTDDYLMSIGGSDTCVIQWKLVHTLPEYIKRYHPLKS